MLTGQGFSAGFFRSLVNFSQLKRRLRPNFKVFFEKAVLLKEPETPIPSNVDSYSSHAIPGF